MSPDRDAKPVLVSVSRFQKMAGEAVDPSECAAILSRRTFEDIYARWLEWEVDDAGKCSLPQLCTKSG